MEVVVGNDYWNRAHVIGEGVVGDRKAEEGIEEDRSPVVDLDTGEGIYSGNEEEIYSMVQNVGPTL